ncbi:ABC transporter permease [Spirochaetia bacterium]|nr:ABC transporter permease [Spirochaetia bacterium]
MEEMSSKLKLFNKNIVETYSLILVVIALGVALSIITNTFLTPTNLLNVLRQISINGILAIGMTFVILTGGIDLSVGSVVAFCGIVAAGLVRDGHWSNGPVILTALVVGVILGLFNGYFVAYWNAAPFVVTLSLMTIARGMTFVYCNGRPISPLTAEFLSIGRNSFLGLPIPALILLLVFIIGFVVLKYFSIGRYIYAVGGNENSAIVSGINTKLVKLFAYAVSGALCGLVAVVLTSRVSAGMPQAGQSYELDAIAATVIGGTSLSGGRGRLWGTVLGALLLGIVSNGLDLMNVSSFYQQIVKGVIILGAILIDSKR